MPWFCKECKDLILLNSNYCNKCSNFRRSEEKIKEDIERILKEIMNYKDTQIINIKIKYGIIIAFSDLNLKKNEIIYNSEENIVNIINKNYKEKYKIDKFEQENNELKEALNELRDTDNEVFR